MTEEEKTEVEEEKAQEEVEGLSRNYSVIIISLKKSGRSHMSVHPSVRPSIQRAKRAHAQSH